MLTTSAPARTTKNPRALSRGCAREFSVATENSPSRQSWLTLCRDKDFLGRDGFWVAEVLVSRQ